MLYWGDTLRHMWMLSGIEALLSTPRHVAVINHAVYLHLEHEICRTAFYAKTWAQIRCGICNPIGHAINSTNHA